MVGSVARSTMAVPVAVLAWDQPSEKIYEICFGARSRLHERHTGRGVRDEDVHQAVPPPGTKAADVVGEVHDLAIAGVDREDLGTPLRARWFGG